MPSRSLSYAKIMQTERRTTSLLDCYAEVQLILCKDNARREQNHQACLDVMPSRSLSYAKILILFNIAVVLNKKVHILFNTTHKMNIIQIKKPLIVHIPLSRVFGNVTLGPRHDEHQAGKDETGVYRPAGHLFYCRQGGLHLHLALG